MSRRLQISPVYERGVMRSADACGSLLLRRETLKVARCGEAHISGHRHNRTNPLTPSRVRRMKHKAPTNKFKTIKAALAAGFREKRPLDYGGEEIVVKDHTLVRNAEEAVAMTV